MDFSSSSDTISSVLDSSTLKCLLEDFKAIIYIISLVTISVCNSNGDTHHTIIISNIIQNYSLILKI